MAMRDKRAWAPVDIGYLDNPKMLDVLDASSTATLMHLASILYCAQHLTDGHLSPGVARRKVGADNEDVRVLVESGLWHESGHECEDCPQPEAGKVYVHDFLEHNRTAEEANQVSSKRSKAARKRWADEKAQDVTSNAASMQSAVQDAEQDAMQNADVCNAEREREIKPSPAPYPEGFDEFWAAYPKKDAKKAALKIYERTIKDTNPEDIINGAKRYAQYVRAEKKERKFIKSPDGWLNAGRWEDDIPSDDQQPITKNPLWDP